MRRRLKMMARNRNPFDVEMLTAADDVSKSLQAQMSQNSRAQIPENSKPLAPARWDWTKVRRVLVVRLRSIGDTVLATPSLHALRRFLPGARIDVLLEDWVAPVLDGCTDADEVITIKRDDLKSRLQVARKLRAARYDVAYNLHGGSTSVFLMRASGATHRVGYASYRYNLLQTDNAPPASELWQRTPTHSAEQQLALLGFTGVPVTDLPPTRLNVTAQANASLNAKLRAAKIASDERLALIHPAAAFDTKRWAAENFARIIEHLSANHGLKTVAVAALDESEIVRDVINHTRTELRPHIIPMLDLTLPEVTALAARAQIFVGNDSGIAHIATAVGAPVVIIFGSSNVAHWRPFTPDAQSEKRAVVVRETMPCAPCQGYTCSEFEQPECIRRVKVESVIAAIEKLFESG